MSERDPRSELTQILEILTALQGPSPRAEVAFLSARGWLPFGKRAITGIEGWGKMIDGKAVIVDEPEALSIEGKPLCDVYHSVMHSHPVRCRLPLNHQQEQHEAMVDGKVLRWP